MKYMKNVLGIVQWKIRLRTISTVLSDKQLIQLNKNESKYLKIATNLSDINISNTIYNEKDKRKIPLNKKDILNKTKDDDNEFISDNVGKPLITVFGIGGAGTNAVNNMISSQLEGVEFIVANTDCQALGYSLATHKIILGKELTKGLGAGSKPELGRLAAEAQKNEIKKYLKGRHMLFITGGMGGGTFTGAAPIIANIAKELGILTVGVISVPFHSEGPNRTRIANIGVKELSKSVDTLIIVPNQNLLFLSDKKTTIIEAFRYANKVLLEGVKGVTDLIVKPGLINLDFADINTVLSNAGRAIMGSGKADTNDTNRAVTAAIRALTNPLLGKLPTESATGLLVTIRGGDDMTLFEVEKIMETIRKNVSKDANIIFGTCYEAALKGSIYVSLIVGGIKTDTIAPIPDLNEYKNINSSKEIINETNHDKISKISKSKHFLRRFFTL